METAMQELIEYMSNNFSGKFPEGYDQKMAELLEKEKQMAKDFFEAGEIFNHQAEINENNNSIPIESPDFKTFYTQYLTKK